ncbi:M16 family metallopeptidase [Helicobacter saguini]|nr:pitrilysin family protein [Helicobacter saguini]
MSAKDVARDANVKASDNTQSIKKKEQKIAQKTPKDTKNPKGVAVGYKNQNTQEKRAEYKSQSVNENKTDYKTQSTQAKKANYKSQSGGKMGYKSQSIKGGKMEYKSQDSLTFLEVKGVKIPVIFESSKVLPIGHLELNFIGGGSVFNPPKKPLSKVGANLLNYGTKTLGNVGFANLLESKAISLQASDSPSTLSISLDFLSEFEDFALERLADLLQNPNLTQKALNDIQTKLKATLLSKSADFDYQARILLYKSVFAHTPLAYPALGNNAKEIDSVDLKDVKGYLDSNLVLSRLTIVLGGDLDIESSLKKIKNILANLSVGTSVDTPHYAVKPATIKEVKKDTQQAFIYFASPLALSDMRQEAYKARVVGFILGSSGFGSRLMEEIRVKRGLAYSAYMYPNLTRLSTHFVGQMQTALDKQDEAIKITQDLLNEFVKNGATAEELESAKQFILGNKPLQEETLEQRLGAKYNYFMSDLPLDYRDEFVRQVQELDLATLNAYIKAHPEIANVTFAVIRN